MDVFKAEILLDMYNGGYDVKWTILKKVLVIMINQHN